MFAIEVSSEFFATHQLRLPPRLGGGLEELHAHQWKVTVRAEAPGLDDLDTVMDFHIVQEALAEIIGPWNNRQLNDIPPFDGAVNPSAERVAECIGMRLRQLIPAVLEVRLTEAPGCVAIWRA